MTTLYVDRKGVSVRVDANTLVFDEGGVRVGCVPLGPLERVVLRGDVTLQASVLGKLGELGVGVVVLSGRKAVPTMLMHRPHNDAQRRVRQFECMGAAGFRLAAARALVGRKLVSQRALLAQRLDDDLMHRYELTTAVRRISTGLDALPAAESLASLRGIEGAAAQAYFGGYQALFAPALKFSGRNRRPPKDPVNALLSLGYTLAHAEVVLQLYAGGLDPFIGFFHELDFGRESLACDLMEPLRTGVDALVLRLFRERVLEAAHFSQVQDACLLGKAGRAHFYQAWEPAAEALRVALKGEVAWLLGLMGCTAADAAPEDDPDDEPDDE